MNMMHRFNTYTDEQGAAVESLPPEYAAEGAVVLATNFPHDGIHGPAIQLLVRNYLQRQAILLLIALDTFQRIVAVPAYNVK